MALGGSRAGRALAALSNDKYGFHPCGADPPHLPLPPTLLRSAFQAPSEAKETDMTTYTLNVPYEFTKNGRTERRYRRVGAVFENIRRDTGETFLSIKLDFPVAVTELVAFLPSPRDGDQPPIDD